MLPQGTVTVVTPFDPRDLYDAAGTRALDRAASEDLGLAGVTLMERAGQAAFDALTARWPTAGRISIVCGIGNNGGDGFVIADLASNAGLDVEVILVGDRNRLAGDAAACFAKLEGSSIAVQAWAQDLNAPDVIVDALLGTGLDRDVGGDHAAAIERMNADAAPILSVDLPSGINASTGRCMGRAVTAALTVTFIGLKQGLMTGDAVDYTGEIAFDDLEVPPAVYRAVPATARLVQFEGIRDRFMQRARNAHKGHYGHVLVVGGAPGFGGAVRMAGEAAARSGAGLVSVATDPAHAAAVTQARPELMCHSIGDAIALRPLLKRATVIAIGPGLGQSEWSHALLSVVRECALPTIMDADALNLLADDPDEHAARIITPHPGEAARLLHVSADEIQTDRFAAARALSETFGGVVVLKGAGTLVQTAHAVPRIIGGGNPGMASGGMGDVLTGIIAGLTAQGFPLPEAATLGACVHAYAADQAAGQDGERGLLASDLMPFIRSALNP